MPRARRGCRRRCRHQPGHRPAKLKSYFQLLVDPAVVLPEYLAGWLNSPIGYALRQLAMTDATIPRIKRDLLAESRLYLPSIEEQMVAIKAVREIRSMRSELAELESRIWDRPREASDVSEAVGRVNHEDRFSDWTETLPFPLAAILRTYHASDRLDKETRQSGSRPSGDQSSLCGHQPRRSLFPVPL